MATKKEWEAAFERMLATLEKQTERLKVKWTVRLKEFVDKAGPPKPKGVQRKKKTAGKASKRKGRP